MRWSNLIILRCVSLSPELTLNVSLTDFKRWVFNEKCSNNNSNHDKYFEKPKPTKNQHQSSINCFIIFLTILKLKFIIYTNSKNIIKQLWRTPILTNQIQGRLEISFKNCNTKDETEYVVLKSKRSLTHSVFLILDPLMIERWSLWS